MAQLDPPLGYGSVALRDWASRLAAASALEDLGRLQVAEGATDDAIASLDRALAIDAQVGASWDAARVRRRLRQLGVRRRIITSKRPATGWEALTSAEAAIAQLASEGKTNREIAETLFISPHTVNSHLRHIFDKLGVNSRVSLTRMAGGLEPSAPTEPPRTAVPHRLTRAIDTAVAPCPRPSRQRERHGQSRDAARRSSP